MPLAIDPSAKLRLILDSDAGKDPPPTFVYHHLTGRQWRQLAALTVELKDADLNRVIDILYQAVQIGFIGLENIDASAIGSLDELLTPAECNELVDKILQQGFAASDKKKCGSPSDCGSAASAKSPATPPAASAALT